MDWAQDMLIWILEMVMILSLSPDQNSHGQSFQLMVVIQLEPPELEEVLVARILIVIGKPSRNSKKRRGNIAGW
jgi:hypothetical protein